MRLTRPVPNFAGNISCETFKDFNGINGRHFPEYINAPLKNPAAENFIKLSFVSDYDRVETLEAIPTPKEELEL